MQGSSMPLQHSVIMCVLSVTKTEDLVVLLLFMSTTWPGVLLSEARLRSSKYWSSQFWQSLQQAYIAMRPCTAAEHSFLRSAARLNQSEFRAPITSCSGAVGEIDLCCLCDGSRGHGHHFSVAKTLLTVQQCKLRNCLYLHAT